MRFGGTPPCGCKRLLVAGAAGRTAQERPAKARRLFLSVQNLVEDFLQHLRHERGQAEHTQRTYAALLGKFVGWAGTQGIKDWVSVQPAHLMNFLQHEQQRTAANAPKGSARRLSTESLYLQIAALRAFTGSPKTRNSCR